MADIHHERNGKMAPFHLRKDRGELEKLRLQRLNTMSDTILQIKPHRAVTGEGFGRMNEKARKLEERFIHRASLFYRKKLAEAVAERTTALHFSRSVTSFDGNGRVVSSRTEPRDDVSWEEKEVYRERAMELVLETFDQQFTMNSLRKSYEESMEHLAGSGADAIRWLGLRMPPTHVIECFAKAFKYQLNEERGYTDSGRGWWMEMQKMIAAGRIQDPGVR